MKNRRYLHFSGIRLKRLLCGILVMVPLALATVSTGAELKGVTFSDTITAGDHTLHVRGMGQLRWLLFKVCIAALYLPEEVLSSDVLEDTPKRIEFRYFVDIKAEEFAESAGLYLARNVPADLLARIGPRIDALNSLYRDVSEGDRYALTYRPGRGTELELNGEILGEVPGADFASAYYQIWLGDDPLDKGLKRALLNTGESRRGSR